MIKNLISCKTLLKTLVRRNFGGILSPKKINFLWVSNAGIQRMRQRYEVLDKLVFLKWGWLTAILQVFFAPRIELCTISPSLEFLRLLSRWKPSKTQRSKLKLKPFKELHDKAAIFWRRWCQKYSFSSADTMFHQKNLYSKQQ